MNIHKEGLFYVDHGVDGILSIGIETQHLSECVNEVMRREAKGVFGSPTFGFKQDNLDFLERITHIERVWFWDIDLVNIDGLYSLGNLRHFGVHPKRPNVDFSKFPKLNTIVWEYKARDTGITQLKQLKDLDLWGFKPKSKSFEGVGLPVCIEEFQISWSNIITLKGLPEFNDLKRFEIHHCKNLGDLSGLESIAPNLEYLIVTGSGMLSSESIQTKNFTSLKHVSIMGEILTL